MEDVENERRKTEARLAKLGMATGKVALPWSQLRPRKTDPKCVLDAIAVEDLHSLVRMMAVEPLGRFDDSSIMRSKLLSLRRSRIDICNNNNNVTQFES